MAGWWTLLAALGGTALGLGLGLFWGSRRATGGGQTDEVVLSRLRSELERSVLPILEAHARELGLASEIAPPRSIEASETRVVRLGVSIHQHQLQYTDTLPLDAGPHLRPSKPRGDR